MAKIHDRILELGLTMNAAADTVTVTSVKYYRDRGKLEDGNGYSVTFVQGAAVQPNTELEFDQVLPPATKLRFVFAAF